MLAILGKSALTLALIFNLLSLLTNNKLKQKFYYAASIMPAIALIMLIISYITSDFSLAQVFLNSSNLLPLIFKIAAIWSNHEGSILLWLTMISLISLWGYIRSFNIFEICKYNSSYINFSALTISPFIIFIIITSSPFEVFHIMPKQGLGLNPMLQDDALVMHPPLLYFAYVLTFICYVNSLVLLYNMPRQNSAVLAGSDEYLKWQIYERQLYACNRFFTILSLGSLTAAIALGSWWAYRELGWGGYWFFDPVENISLMPYLSMLALAHSHIYYFKHSSSDSVNNECKFRKSILFFSILSFLLTIYGFFFVRSGIISSVHSFAFSAEKGIFIISINIFLTIMSSYLFLSRLSVLQVIAPDKISSNIIIYIQKFSNIIWFMGILVLNIGVSYPIFLINNAGEEIAIDPEYYYHVFLPLAIPVLLFAALTPHLFMRAYGSELSANIFNKKQYYLIAEQFVLIALSVIFASIIFINIEVWQLEDIMPSSYNFKVVLSFFTIIFAIYLMLSAVSYLIKNTYSKTYKKNVFGVFLSHFGFGLLALVISLNANLSSEIFFSGKVGDEIMPEENKVQNQLFVKLAKVSFADNPNYYRQIAHFLVIDKYGNNIFLKPENRYYKIERKISSEADIYSFLTYDIHGVISSNENNIINAHISYKPLMSILWFASFLIALGFIYNLDFRRK